MHAPLHGAHNIAQQLLRKTLNFISPEQWPIKQGAKLNCLQHLGSLQQREYELHFNKI